MDQKDLGNVLRAMKENADLYRNIECRYYRDREFLVSENFKGATLNVWSETRVVLQGSLYYARETVRLREPDGKIEEMTSEYGYDGEITRANDHNVGNIAYERFPVGPWITPQQMAFPGFFKQDVADYIGGSDEVRAMFPEFDWDSELLGTETIGDLPCYKVAYRVRRKGSPLLGARELFWIAPDRNHLPVRWEKYVISLNDSLPSEVADAGDWRELAPGIWAPFRGTLTHYSQRDLKKGIAREETRCTTIVTYVRLDPQYGIDLFRNIAMPNDAPIYTIKGGEIVDEKIPIGLPTTATSDNMPPVENRTVIGRWLTTFLLGAGFLGVGLAVWAWRRAK